ncbi:hypothetical protein Marme_3682 [Marinomonas mediterranea MMB-1]|uniref:DUF7217 domain-containing protein n=2 Tax=Marinomonas mediterranea TaxID=119864 RepID=F2JW05_MARM1|nr:hypothetical protein Marme_3682 [Marinomonas mediterranea MMB-1]
MREMLQSATTTKASQTGGYATQLQIKLNKYLPIEPVDDSPATTILPDEAKVQRCMTALDNYGEGANVLNAHVQSRLASFMEDMQIASTAKMIDSYISGTPASCVNINTIAGSLAGATDTLLDSTNDLLTELDQGITNYDASTLPLNKFEALLDRVSNTLEANAATILGTISNETQELAKMYETHKKMAMVMAVPALIKDDCIRPLLVRVAGAELIPLLTDEMKFF